MRKWIVIVCLVCSLTLVAIPAYAHLTGAFAEYLAVVYDDSTISNLKQELSDTKEEIEELTPKVEKLEHQFSEKQDVAIDQLLGYSDVGLDTWYTMLSDNKDIVDLLGDQWIMQKAIHHYMDSVNDLYLLYNEVNIQKQTLQGHSELLKVIEKSLERRKEYLAENEGLPLENIANYLDIDWTSEVEKPIIQSMKRDNQQVRTHFASFIDNKNGSYMLNEDKLNAFSHAHYFFRADHIYVEFHSGKEQVILIGQVLQNKQGTKAELTFEAGYYNGFFLPNEDLVEIPPIEFSYEVLKRLKGISDPYMKQVNGWIEIKTK